MPLIEGIGDEVLHFTVLVVVLTVAAMAWWSTNARPERYRTVLLMRSHASSPFSLNMRFSGIPPSMLFTNRINLASTPPTTESVVTSTPNAIQSNSSSAANDAVPLQEMDSIVDADMALLDNNRLHFYRRVNNSRRAIQATTETATATESTETQEEAEPASNAQIREMDSIVNAMEADVFGGPNGNDSNSNAVIPRVPKENKDTTPSVAAQVDTTGSNGEGDQPPADDNERKILIRLKYLNDTQKEVEGNLDELLKDFKWRHFSTELSSEYRVRLIFNGRVLVDEAATLRALGLHHRAVVHCLVHPRRAPVQRGTDEVRQATLEVGAARAAPDRSWDFENILMTLVSVALTIVWFFRCEYSNMFTASASVALFGLTVFYSVAIFGLYLSDTFQFERRQPQAALPVPNE